MPAREVEAVVWSDARCAALAGEVLGRMGNVRVLGVGGPHKAQVTALAESFDTRVDDDLRKMLVDRPAGFLLLATGEGASGAGLEQARKSGTVVLAIEPTHNHHTDQVAPEDRLGDGSPGVMIAPWMRMSPAWQAAADPQQALGAIQSLHVLSLSPPHTGSLYARLYDAADMLVHLMGMPATIDAALTGPLAQPPEELRGLTGHLTAHLRFGSDAAAVLHVSDRATTWTRRLTAIGADGQLMLDDAGYRLTATEGREIDRLSPPDEAPDPAGLIVHQWRRLVDRPHTPPPVNPRRLIACCQAALLSCRTGEPESPETLMHLRGA